MRRRTLLIALGLLAAGAAGALAIPPVRRLFHPLTVRLRGARTIDQRVAEFTDARTKVRALCERAGVGFPPRTVTLLGLKDERRLEVYAGASADDLRLLTTYPILAGSGTLGPKLREGDRQVPEGVYAVESLNPNSRFHVALRVGYPNAFDRAAAAREGRSELGSDIMIHGGSASVGCLAMGDSAAEELFVLAAGAGVENVTVVLSPMDLRTRALPPAFHEGWRRELYAELKSRIRRLQL